MGADTMSSDPAADIAAQVTPHLDSCPRIFGEACNCYRAERVEAAARTIRAALDAARAEEREASARECELYAAVHRKLGEARSVYPDRVRPPVGDAAACDACAAAIRGRG
jgi:hypothetical protein